MPLQRQGLRSKDLSYRCGFEDGHTVSCECVGRSMLRPYRDKASAGAAERALRGMNQAAQGLIDGLLVWEVLGDVR